MSRLSVDDILILNLAQRLPPDTDAYLSRESAYELLKGATGQDFGYDIDQWNEWLTKNPTTSKDFARAVARSNKEKGNWIPK